MNMEPAPTRFENYIASILGKSKKETNDQFEIHQTSQNEENYAQIDDLNNFISSDEESNVSSDSEFSESEFVDIGFSGETEEYELDNEEVLKELQSQQNSFVEVPSLPL